MKLVLPRRRVCVSRKAMLMGVFTLVGLMITYAIYSLAAWNGYQASYQRYEKDAMGAISGALNKKTSDQYSAADKLADIREQALEVKKMSASQCRPPVAAGWLTASGSIKQKADDCKKQMGHLASRAEKLYEASAAMEIENQLADIIKKATEKSEGSLPPESWQSSHQVWADALQDAENLLKGQGANAGFDHLLASIRQAEAAWKRVIDASGAQDEPGFEDAKERLIQAYAELASLSE